ncbi:MAG: hypothetical protein Q9177_003888 [Variospora cf. flavescens]
MGFRAVPGVLLDVLIPKTCDKLLPLLPQASGRGGELHEGWGECAEQSRRRRVEHHDGGTQISSFHTQDSSNFTNNPMIRRPPISYIKLSITRWWITRHSSTAAATAAKKKLPPSSSLHHHDLPSFLAHARRTGLSPTSTLYTGTRYEYICLQTLARLSFTLTRTGGRADHGIDLLGHWHPANASSSLSHPLRVLVQCKALRSKPAPALIRELEGIYAGAPAGWRNGDTTIAVLVAKRPATKGVREALRCSRVPVVWVMLEDLAERDGGYVEEEEEMGRVRQILWNAKVIELGVEGLGVGVRYLSSPSSSSGERRRVDGGGKVEKEIVLTWKGEPVVAGREEEG